MKLSAVAALAALVLAALTPLAASADELVYTPRTHVLNMNIGCQQGADGTTCNTTSYWLGRGVGDNNVGSSNDFTPLGYASGGASQEFPGDDTLDDSYVIDAGRNLAGVVQMVGFLGPVAAADATVAISVRGHVVGTPGFQTVTIASGEVNKAADTNGTFNFDLDIADELDKVEVDNLTVTVTKGAVNLLSWGFMNGQGGSNIRLPFYEVTEA